MTFTIITLIVDALQRVFGGSLFLPLIVIAIISILILAVKGGKILFFIILVPMVTTIVVFGVQSSMFQGMTVDIRWIAVTGWMALGLIMAIIFWKIVQ